MTKDIANVSMRMKRHDVKLPKSICAASMKQYSIPSNVHSWNEFYMDSNGKHHKECSSRRSWDLLQNFTYTYRRIISSLESRNFIFRGNNEKFKKSWLFLNFLFQCHIRSCTFVICSCEESHEYQSQRFRTKIMQNIKHLFDEEYSFDYMYYYW